MRTSINIIVHTRRIYYIIHIEVHTSYLYMHNLGKGVRVNCARRIARALIDAFFVKPPPHTYICTLAKLYIVQGVLRRSTYCAISSEIYGYNGDNDILFIFYDSRSKVTRITNVQIKVYILIDFYVLVNNLKK